MCVFAASGTLEAIALEVVVLWGDASLALELCWNPVSLTRLLRSVLGVLPSDGLYVLLRPHKTKKNGSADVPPPRAPEHLAHMLMRQLPPETCPWSLSGPQYVVVGFP